MHLIDHHCNCIHNEGGREGGREGEGERERESEL